MAFCSNCGSQLAPNENPCKKCDVFNNPPLNQPAQSAPVAPSSQNIPQQPITQNVAQQPTSPNSANTQYAPNGQQKSSRLSISAGYAS